MSYSASLFTPRTGENAYFAAANGFDGFRSYYPSLYRSEHFTRVFVIKGGPGTGKSRLLREAAVTAEAIGAHVDYIYCSSDPASLDGVILYQKEKRIALLDGTAPHARCADIPGAIDEIINLGDFWNSELLTERRDEILSVSREKSTRFALAYSYLRVAGIAFRERKKLLNTAFLKEKAENAVLRFLKAHKEKRGSSARVLQSGIGMRGEVFLKTYLEKANAVYCVEDLFGFSGQLLSVFETELKKQSLAFVGIEDHMAPDNLLGIYLPENKILLLSKSVLPKELSPCKSFTASRFLDPALFRKLRPDLRRITTLYSEACLSAGAAFRSAGEAHFTLESIYITAMNFQEKERLSLLLSKRILHLLSDKVDNSADM